MAKTTKKEMIQVILERKETTWQHLQFVKTHGKEIWTDEVQYDLVYDRALYAWAEIDRLVWKFELN